MNSLRTGLFTWLRAVPIAGAVALAGSVFAANPAATPAPAPAKKASTAPTKTASAAAAAVPAKEVAKARPPAVTPAPKNPAAPKGTSVPAATEPHQPEFADAFPSEVRPPAPDLQLTPEATRRAEAQAEFAKALVAEDNAETDQALAGYRKVLELDPGYADLAVQVAYKLAQRNDVAGAIQVLKDTIKAAPKEPQPLVYLSQLYAKYLKKPDLAMKYAEQAIALAPDNFNAHLAIYELHMAAGQPKKAEEVLDRAAKSKSTEAKFWIQLGDLYTRLYLKEDGSSQPADLEKMNALYRKAAGLGKGDAMIQAKVGDYFVLSRQVKEAIPFYVAALSGKPTSEEGPLNNLRDKLARAFLVTEQRDEAIKMLEQIVVESPLRFETYELLGELYEKKGDSEKALSNYEHSLLLDGSRPDNYLHVADMYLKHKDADRAVDVMRKARAKFPDVPEIVFSLAVTLSQAKRHTDAMTAFAEALADAESNHEEMLTGSFYFQYGAAAEQAGLFDKAAELFRESIRLDPENAAEAYNYMGYMWVEHDMHLDEGGEMIKKALELAPDSGAFLDSLGWYYYKKGDAVQALTQLLKAAENMPEEDATVFEHIGDTYQKLGKPTEALDYWQKAQGLDAGNKSLAEKISTAKQQAAPGAGTADKAK